MAELHISFEEYRKKTEQLAAQIYKDGWKFNQVVCIAKGGMRVGDIMARIFDVPLAVLSVESYRGDGVKNKRGSITFSRDLAKTSPNIGSKVLIVDDLADSGITLKKSIETTPKREATTRGKISKAPNEITDRKISNDLFAISLFEISDVAHSIVRRSF